MAIEDLNIISYVKTQYGECKSVKGLYFLEKWQKDLNSVYKRKRKINQSAVQRYRYFLQYLNEKDIQTIRKYVKDHPISYNHFEGIGKDEYFY